jgi:hypothetical protein
MHDKIAYNRITKVTDKMKEARDYVDSFIKQRKEPPSYNVVARKLKIDHSGAYYRLRGYRHKMRSRGKSK